MNIFHILESIIYEFLIRNTKRWFYFWRKLMIYFYHSIFRDLPLVALFLAFWELFIFSGLFYFHSVYFKIFLFTQYTYHKWKFIKEFKTFQHNIIIQRHFSARFGHSLHLPIMQRICRSWFQSPLGAIFNDFFCSSLCKDLSDNLTEKPVMKNSIGYKLGPLPIYVCAVGIRF